MSPNQIAPGLIEEAIATVKMETSKIKTRARLCSTKIRDILDDIDQLEKYLEEQKGEATCGI
jgi:prefoldin subunit 5